MAPSTFAYRNDEIPTASDETTTTTTSPPSQDSGGGAAPRDPKSPFAGIGSSEKAANSGSPWLRNFTSVSTLRATYYTTDKGETPYQARLFDYRTEFAQTGNADLGNVLDHSLKWERGREGYTGSTGGSRAPSGSGTGSKTVAAWLDHMREMDSEALAKRQTMLFEAGYYAPAIYKDPRMLTPGVYDEATQSAWTMLLKDGAMSNDIPLSELLRRRKEAVDAQGGIEAYMNKMNPEPEPPPFTATVTNPLDVASAQRSLGQELMGREMSDPSAAGQFQGLEVGAQRAAYDATYGSGGTTTEAPNLGAFVENDIRQDHAPEVGAYSYLQNFNVLLARLGLG